MISITCPECGMDNLVFNAHRIERYAIYNKNEDDLDVSNWHDDNFMFFAEDDLIGHRPDEVECMTCKTIWDYAIFVKEYMGELKSEDGTKI